MVLIHPDHVMWKSTQPMSTYKYQMEYKSGSDITQEELAEGMPRLENIPTCSGYSAGPNYLEVKKLPDKFRDYQQFLTRDLPEFQRSLSKRRNIKAKEP